VHHFNLTHVGFYCFLFFLRKFTWTFSFTHVRAPPQKRRFPQFLVNIVLYSGPTKYIICARFLPPHHHHRSSILLAPSGLTSCTSRVTPSKSRYHLQPICSLMSVPGSGRRSPTFLGLLWQTRTLRTTMVIFMTLLPSSHLQTCGLHNVLYGLDNRFIIFW